MYIHVLGEQTRVETIQTGMSETVPDPESFDTDFWYGSRSADPYHGLTDPDPALFVSDLQDANKKYFFSKFFCLLLIEDTYTVHHCSNIYKTVKSRFCLMMEVSRSTAVPLTNESGTGRPENQRILLIRIWNTGVIQIFLAVSGSVKIITGPGAGTPVEKLRKMWQIRIVKASDPEGQRTEYGKEEKEKSGITASTEGTEKEERKRTRVYRE